MLSLAICYIPLETSLFEKLQNRGQTDRPTDSTYVLSLLAGHYKLEDICLAWMRYQNICLALVYSQKESHSLVLGRLKVSDWPLIKT